MKLLTSLFLLIGVLSVGYTQEPVKPFYAGVGLGAMDYEEDLTIIDPELASFSDSTRAWKVYGGYNFNRYFGVEGSYMRSGDSSGVASGADPIDGDFALSAKADFRGYSVKAMGYLPLSWGMLFGGLGHYQNRSDLSFAASFDCCEAELLSSSDRFHGFTGQVGTQWNLGSVILRVEYEWWHFSEGGASVLGLGAQWEF
jgi:hypothetical protein